jgi:putative ABC transport system permease protein
VVQQFLLEAIFVSLAGGIIGVAIGWGGMQLVTRLEKLPQILIWQPFAAAIVLSLAVGVVFGLSPAWKASRVDPIQALRS